MKRILIIALVALSLFGLLAVSASAVDDQTIINVEGGQFLQEIPGRLLTGEYYLTVYDTNLEADVLTTFFSYEDPGTYQEFDLTDLPYILVVSAFYDEASDSTFFEGDITEGGFFAEDFEGYLVFDGLVVESTGGNPLQSVLDMFAGVGGWILSSLSALSVLFWSGSKLTLLGVLAVVGLAFGVIFLLIFVIQNFLHFKS